MSLQWRHNERGSVSNHQRLHYLLNCRFRRRSKKILKLRVTSLCEGNSPVTDEFPTQKPSNSENVSIWWRHHVFRVYKQTEYLMFWTKNCSVSIMVSQITSESTECSTVYSTIYSDDQQQRYWLALKGNHRLPVDSRVKEQVIRKTFRCHDVIMLAKVESWKLSSQLNGRTYHVQRKAFWVISIIFVATNAYMRLTYLTALL